jgi:hypothetical protein
MHHLAGKCRRLTTTALIAWAAFISGSSFAGKDREAICQLAYLRLHRP